MVPPPVPHTLWASCIVHRIYLGDLDSLNILPPEVTHIISILSEKRSLPTRVTKRNHLFIAAGDNENQDLLSMFSKCYKFIQNALEENSTNEVLIHCRAGRSRSATIATMYLMRTYRWNYDEAKKYLLTRRPLVKINDGKNIVEIVY